MPFITAQQIHNGHRWLPQNTVIEVADDGTIIALHDNLQSDDMIRYDGILAPAFINAHCHLELSHMKGVISEHTGLIPFLKVIPLHRNDFTEEQKKIARHSGYDELVRNGVIAVGDIANTTDALELRDLDKMHFYTFVESLGFTAANAPKMFAYATGVYDAYAAQATGDKILKQAIVPHAPYSVSSALFRLIDKHQDSTVISIHNQESREEDKYYIAKEGTVKELLTTLGIDDAPFVPSGKSSLQTYLEWMSSLHPFMFIHNTYTQLQDIQFAHSRLEEVYWCLCPNANRYIENTLPDVDMFIRENATLCIGTDSLASNHELSIASELTTLKNNFPYLEWETLLTWATYNGACALQMQGVIGSIQPGLKPGIIQIKKLEQNAPTVKRII